MYKLYYSPGACSMAIHVMLNELGQQVTLENVKDANGQVKKDFFDINQRGAVPVLFDNEQKIREGAAIIIHILEKHKSALLPASDPERATALEWLMFANSTLHPAYGRAFFALKNFDGDTQKKVLDAALPVINKLWEEVEQRLANSQYICGKALTAADILLAVIANWSGMSAKFEGKIKIGENTKRLFREVVARPAYQKALATEQVEYNVAA